MRNKLLKNMLLVGTGTVALVVASTAQEFTTSDLKDRLILDMRLRFESVDQEWGGDADALTLRTRLGYESEDYGGFGVLVEGEFSDALDDDDFDAYPGAAGTLGKAIIADGETSELNRAQLTYTGGEFAMIIGRQRIILDNARFVGNVGWRQNEQTFDAATFVYTPHEKHRVLYAYVDRVQRIFGSQAVVGAQRSLDTGAHVFNYNFKPAKNRQFGFYAYDIGVENSSASSSSTVGGFYEGVSEFDGGVKATSRIEYARQVDNSRSPAGSNYKLDYLHLSVNAKKDAYSVGVGFEMLEGNGENGFSTPLATLHAFNGWADVFLATPANGLLDAYLWVGYDFSSNLKGKLVYHNFDSDVGPSDYGGEIDAVLSWKINELLSGTLKYAEYNGKGGAPGKLRVDRTKVWLQLDLKY